MRSQKSPNTLVVGLAFFSMFFGSGNLIFPLMLGARYESYFWLSALGFIITAVLLPTLGILAMVPARGCYERLFLDLLPNNYSRWFFFAVLVFWIPLGSGPRCVVLAHASMGSLFDINVPLWLFSTLFLVTVYLCVKIRARIIDILGKWLTPLLLLSIFFIVLSSFFHTDIQVSTLNAANVFIDSVIDGYYTQDLIAAVFFSAALINMLRLENEEPAVALRKTLHGGIIAAVLLAILYISLMAASAAHAHELHNLSGEQLVSRLAHLALGPTFGALSSVAVSLACLTTEIALVVVFADFMSQHLLRRHDSQIAMWITLVIILLMSQLEFGGIMAIVAPAMKVIYPILFLLVIRCLWRNRNVLTENMEQSLKSD